MRALFVLLILSLATPVAAQDADARRFGLAERYIRAGQYDRAIGLLETLYQKSPEVPAYYSKLKEAYLNQKLYDDALRLVDDQLNRQRTPTLLAERGAVLFRVGDEAGADAAWAEAVAHAPSRTSTYRAVYFTLSELRLYDRAISVLEQGRQASGDSTLFRNDLAALYGLTAKHAKAMREYISVLAESPDQLGFVRRRFGRFSQHADALREGLEVAEKAVRDAPLNRTFRELLGWLQMEVGEYADAYRTYAAIDRLEKQEGQVLLGFARQARYAGALDEAGQAYTEILNRYPDAISAPTARYMAAELLVEKAESLGERAFDAGGNRVPAPNYDAAIEAYRTFVANHPGDARRSDALLALGKLQLDVYRDLGAAEALLGEVTSSYIEGDAGPSAKFELGTIRLLRNDFDGARLLFNRLVDDLRIGELAQRSRFELARLDFYEGQYDAALARAGALDENTETDIANDAIELKVLLLENKGPDSLHTPLSLYALAELSSRRRQFDEALTMLERILDEFPSHGLIDETRFRRAETLAAAERFEDAAVAYEAVVASHARSYLADRALYALAELYEGPLDDPETAQDTYVRLLESYPGSLLAPEVRARIRALRESA
ncbi:MAG: tetratricopeptide repeat protein [Bacteroidota bacterium]